MVDSPHIILAREFVECAIFFKNFSNSLKLIINHIRKDG